MSTKLPENSTKTIESIISSLKQCLNTSFTTWGLSSNNTTVMNLNFKIFNNSKNEENDVVPIIEDQEEVISFDSPIIEDQEQVISFDSPIVEDQEQVILYASPYHLKVNTIIKLIWKYLSKEDKLNCTMVCKRFNHIVSNMDCFRLVVCFPSKLHFIPQLSRHYKTVIFQHHQCNELKPLMHQMLKNLGQSVIELTFYDCEFSLMTLSEFVREFPLLKSLEVNVNLTMKKVVELSMEDKPKLLQLKDLKIKVNTDKLSEAFEMFGLSSKIESLSLHDAVLSNEEFNDQLRKYKTSLQKLTLTRCIMNKALNLHTLDLSDIRCKLPSKQFTRFDSTHRLCVLKLSDVNDEVLDFFNIKCTNRLTKLPADDTSRHQNKDYNYNFILSYVFKDEGQRNFDLFLFFPCDKYHFLFKINRTDENNRGKKYDCTLNITFDPDIFKNNWLENFYIYFFTQNTNEIIFNEKLELISDSDNYYTLIERVTAVPYNLKELYWKNISKNVIRTIFNFYSCKYKAIKLPNLNSFFSNKTKLN